MKLVIFLSCLAFAVSCYDDGVSSDETFAEREQAIGVVPRGSTCLSLGLGAQSFTLPTVASGDYAIDATNHLKVRFYDATKTDFYFTQSTIRMTGVLASNGDRTMFWDMPGGADGWPSMTGPPDPSTGQVRTPEEITFCYGHELYIQPSPTANMSRRASWSITKTGRTTPLILGEGQAGSLQYSVNVRNTGMTPIGQYIGGNLFVQNKSPHTATVSTVTTMVGALAAAITCPTAPPFTMAPFTTVQCTFRADVPDTTDRTVTASATVSHDLPVSTTPVNASFSSHDTGVTTVDRCVAVFDEASPNAEQRLGNACVEQGPQTFTFTAPVGPYECGDFSVSNTASFVAFDSSATASASWTVNGSVVCDPGCTRSWEHWRDHSQDESWALVGAQGRNTTFFRSGTSYHQTLYVIVLPLLNPYWTLAREYIAARLNQLSGVEMPAATAAAFNEATSLFAANSPLQIQLNLFIHGRLNGLTATLAAFNDGHTGPGVCTP